MWRRAMLGALATSAFAALALLPAPAARTTAERSIGPIVAEFRPAEFLTRYTVTTTGFSDTALASWSLRLTCADDGCPDATGTASAPRPNVDLQCNNDGSGVVSPVSQTLGFSPPEFVWHHPSPADDPTETYHCDHAKEGPHGHQGVITVVVSEGDYACTATYRGTRSSTTASTTDGTASVPECHTTVTPECLRGVTITKRVVDGLEWDKFESLYGGTRNHAVTALGPDEVAVGRRQVFRVVITVRNGGTCTLHDVDVRDAMPLGWKPAANSPPGSSIQIVNTEIWVVPGPGRDPKHPQLPQVTGLSNGQDQVGYVFPELKPGQEGTMIVGGSLPEGGDVTNQARIAAPAELSSNRVVVHVTPNPYITSILATPKSVGGGADDGDEDDYRAAGSRAAPTPPLWRLARVEVAIRALDGAGRRSCRWLRPAAGGWQTARKRLGGCERPVWLRAAGTARWRLRLGRALPPGRYLVRARAVNRAGVTAHRFGRAQRNEIRFAVR